MLIATATGMQRVLRESDILARIGGDEFVAVLLDLPDIQASVPLFTRLLGAARAVPIGGQMLQVSASVGVTFYPQADPIDPDQLLRQADQAMYQAKLAGKNRYHIFDAAVDRSVRRHHETLERIRGALVAREFVLHFQPKVNMRTGTVLGLEALIRWQHPERGLLPPAAFLPVIEDLRLADEIGAWVIETALGQMQQWQTAGLDIPISVNVSARQLQQAGYVERLRALLATHPDLRPGNLVLELLETTALADLDRVSQAIAACRGIGVLCALDDFGAGYASLTYLKRLPVIQIKIDQSFVRDMLDDPDDLAMLDGLISLCVVFRRQVVAVGVETLEQGEMLLQLGCELAQGYGIASPMPAADIPGWVATWRPDPVWVGCAAVNRDAVPLLFAGAAHRAWVAAVEGYLRGERDAPPSLDDQQGGFGLWFDADSHGRPDTRPAFQVIEALHQQALSLAGELCELRAQGRNAQALAGLEELLCRRDAVLEQLKALEQAARGWQGGKGGFVSRTSSTNPAISLTERLLVRTADPTDHSLVVGSAVRTDRGEFFTTAEPTHPGDTSGLLRGSSNSRIGDSSRWRKPNAHREIVHYAPSRGDRGDRCLSRSPLGQEPFPSHRAGPAPTPDGRARGRLLGGCRRGSIRMEHDAERRAVS